MLCFLVIFFDLLFVILFIFLIGKEFLIFVSFNFVNLLFGKEKFIIVFRKLLFFVCFKEGFGKIKFLVKLLYDVVLEILYFVILFLLYEGIFFFVFECFDFVFFVFFGWLLFWKIIVWFLI